MNVSLNSRTKLWELWDGSDLIGTFATDVTADRVKAALEGQADVPSYTNQLSRGELDEEIAEIADGVIADEPKAGNETLRAVGAAALAWAARAHLARLYAVFTHAHGGEAAARAAVIPVVRRAVAAAVRDRQTARRRPPKKG